MRVCARFLSPQNSLPLEYRPHSISPQLARSTDRPITGLMAPAWRPALFRGAIPT